MYISVYDISSLRVKTLEDPVRGFIIYFVTIHEETSNVPHLEHSIIWCWNLDTLESRSEIPGKFVTW